MIKDIKLLSLAVFGLAQSERNDGNVKSAGKLTEQFGKMCSLVGELEKLSKALLQRGRSRREVRIVENLFYNEEYTMAQRYPLTLELLNNIHLLLQMILDHWT